MVRMIKANSHTRKGATSFVAIGCFCKLYPLNKRDVSQHRRNGERCHGNAIIP